MPVDDVDQCVAVRDDLCLIPLAGFDNRFEFVRGAQVSEQGWLLSRFGGNHLAAPRDDSTRRTLLVELAGIFVLVVEVCLVAAKIPLGVLAITLLPFLPLFLLLGSKIRGRQKQWKERQERDRKI